MDTSITWKGGCTRLSARGTTADLSSEPRVPAAHDDTWRRTARSVRARAAPESSSDRRRVRGDSEPAALVSREPRVAWRRSRGGSSCPGDAERSVSVRREVGPARLRTHQDPPGPTRTSLRPAGSRTGDPVQDQRPRQGPETLFRTRDPLHDQRPSSGPETLFTTRDPLHDQRPRPGPETLFRTRDPLHDQRPSSGPETPSRTRDPLQDQRPSSGPGPY
ncbi:unnamed protein product [Gadus morhua 'NCC']